ncbi:SpoIIE family protein phosphatase [Nocardioides mangrovi]|uniref:SpoIIE family protein phosphatase n=1 Tax=Nocardioides mangrovi TaxID=2874580 RepID=A0ABS7UEN7_9ACTN|nr:SpoIIE family protein phosphatase [Nocardioides mangrovi]MBZ5739161.1 SpoIIE family protein phosphatase [Nocardioides mangrovi]
MAESRAAVGPDLSRVCLAAIRALDAPAATLSLVADGGWTWAVGDATATGDSLEVSLTSVDEQVLGTLTVTAIGARLWTDRDREQLEDLAHWAVTELALDRALTTAEADRLAWRLAVDAAGVGAFEWDLVTGDLRWDARLLELFGLDERSFGGTIEAFNERLHPEDLPRVTHALEHAIETCGEYVAEYRILMPGGGVRWIAARGRALASRPGGEAVQLLGAAYDTTAVQEGEARVARVLESMPTAFFQLDPVTWRFTYVNSQAERLLGMTRAEMVGGVIWDLFPGAVDSDFEDRYRYAAETGEPVSFDAYYPPPLDAWYEVRVWPAPDGLAVYFLDVTARHVAQEELDRAARRGHLLSSVTDALAGTLDATEGVSRLADLLVPLLADWCLVTLVDDPSRSDWRRGLRDLGWAHADPIHRDTLSRYADLRLDAMTDASYLVRALHSTTPIVMAQDAAGEIADVLVPGEARDLVRELDPSAAFIVPLPGRDRTVGVLSAFRGRHRAEFSAAEQALLVDIGARAGLALDNARLYAEQRDVSEALQRSLLTEPPQPAGLRIAVRYQPAAEAAQVGGDWYDAFVQSSTATVVVVGDVIGHDVAAAAAMGQVRGLLRGIAAHSGSAPADVIHGVDAVMESLRVDTTATAVVARVERAGADLVVGWSNAGHPPPVLVTADGRVTVLAGPDGNDLLLGFDPATDRHQHTATMAPGATLLLYTDGLVERRGRHIDDGIADLVQHLGELVTAGTDVEDLCDGLLERMVADRPEDDVVVLAVRVDG